MVNAARDLSHQERTSHLVQGKGWQTSQKAQDWYDGRHEGSNCLGGLISKHILVFICHVYAIILYFMLQSLFSL
jgi:hypothetical protein